MTKHEKIVEQIDDLHYVTSRAPSLTTAEALELLNATERSRIADQLERLNQLIEEKG